MTDDSEEQSLTPLFHVMSKLLTANARYHPTERLIVLAIVQRMSREGVCWPSLADIARRTGLDRRTVTKWLSRHLRGPGPLLARTWVPEHKSPTYSLVRDPVAFAKARDASRSDVQHVPPTTCSDPAGVQNEPPAGANGSSLGSNAFHPPVQCVPPKTIMKTNMKTIMKTEATAPTGVSPRRRPLSDEEVDGYLARYQRQGETRSEAIRRLGLVQAGVGA